MAYYTDVTYQLTWSATQLQTLNSHAWVPGAELEERQACAQLGHRETAFYLPTATAVPQLVLTQRPHLLSPSHPHIWSYQMLRGALHATTDTQLSLCCARAHTRGQRKAARR